MLGVIFLSCDFCNCSYTTVSFSEISLVKMVEYVLFLHFQPKGKLRTLLSCFMLD